MKNVKRINESQLKAIITESVKKVLREMNEGAITIGSPEDGHGYHVTIALDSLGPYAEFDVYGVGTDAQAAVDAAVDYLDKQGETGYFWDDEEQAQEYPDDFFTAGNYCHQLRRDLVHIEPIGGLNESTINEYQFGDLYGRDEEMEDIFSTYPKMKRDFDNLVEVIEFYSYHVYEKHLKLSKEQIEQLSSVRDRLKDFGEYGKRWSAMADKIINETKIYTKI